MDDPNGRVSRRRSPSWDNALPAGSVLHMQRAAGRTMAGGGSGEECRHCPPSDDGSERERMAQMTPLVQPPIPSPGRLRYPFVSSQPTGLTPTNEATNQRPSDPATQPASEPTSPWPSPLSHPSTHHHLVPVLGGLLKPPPPPPPLPPPGPAVLSAITSTPSACVVLARHAGPLTRRPAKVNRPRCGDATPGPVSAGSPSPSRLWNATTPTLGRCHRPVFPATNIARPCAPSPIHSQWQTPPAIASPLPRCSRHPSDSQRPRLTPPSQPL